MKVFARNRKSIIAATGCSYLKTGFWALGLMFTISAELLAQPVQFSVNMEHTFVGPREKVVVRGNIPELGNWEESGELILRKRGNQNVYAANLNLKNSHTEPVLYKFVIIRADGTERWEERGNRVWNPENTQTVWFNDRNSPGVQQTVVQVTFTLDLTDHSMNGLPTEGVALMGGHAPLSFDLETRRTEMLQTSEGIWEATVAFPYGTPHDVPFKFAWKHQGEWMWEWRPGHTNHVFLIDDTGTQQTVGLKYDTQLPGVVPLESTTGFVDNYDAVLATLPEPAQAASRYSYEKAMELLRKGQTESATATYAAYKAGHPGGEEIDDFHYRMIHHLRRTQGMQAARGYLEVQLAEEPIRERRDYFGYLKGELALNEGNHAEARRQFKKVQNEGSWEIATNYAAIGMVQSYLRDSDPDSVKRGVTLLERHAARAPQAERRSYLVRLERAYRTTGLQEKRNEVLFELAITGNQVQQAVSKIDLAGQYVEESRASEALGLLDITEFDGNLPKGLQVQLVRLKLRAYHELEMYDELSILYEEYSNTWPQDAFVKRLGELNDQAQQSRRTGRDRQETRRPGIQSAPADSTNN
jgi:outer membrane protein assembly factor BamD (BamD/ComL family)